MRDDMRRTFWFPRPQCGIMADSDLYRKVLESLRESGFWFLRHGKGHEIWTNGHRKVSVPVKMRSRHTANDILKDAGADRKL